MIPYADAKPAEDYTPSQQLIKAECESVCKLLIEKNRAYGDSAIHPVNVMSPVSAVQAIAIRLDDKLSRIKNCGGLEAALNSTAVEDTVQDLIGYLVLARVAKKVSK